MTAHIVAARRSAVIPRGGAFARLSIEDLASPVLIAVLVDAGIARDQVDEIIVSNALGAGGNPARRIALAAGLPDRVAGLTIDRQCAGGLDAILLASAMIAAGQAQVVIAGGVESYSRRPLRLATNPDGGAARPYDEAAFTPWPDRDPRMIDAAAALAANLQISRKAQDDWAMHSHAKAMASGAMTEIVAIQSQTRDAFARHLTPALAARAPVLAGSVTSATAAVAADGAAFVLVVSERIARDAMHALRIGPGVTRGGDPVQPGLAPIAAIAEALARAGLKPDRLTQAEIMEAYAVQAIACVQGAGLDPRIVNPKGGALARGHPIGASGAVLAVRLFHDLQQGTGLAAIASAGGIGTALILQT
jgi:acetyl-CoA C-acetyltransferase